MLKNALDACHAAEASFAYFDNTYMYPQDDRPQTEETPFAPVGRKFHGPGKTQSYTNTLIINRLKQGKKPLVPVRDDTRRTLIWTPDASRALAVLGNAADAFGQAWHLSCCDERPSYKEFIAMAGPALGENASYRVLPKWTVLLAGLFSKDVRESSEMLPRYEQDRLFDSTKLKRRFPEFDVTTYREGVELIRREWSAEAERSVAAVDD